MQATSTETNPPVIELMDADIPSRRDPDTVTVTGVTWTVSQGDFWVIGGLQGSGKSDLLSTAAGLLRPVRGTQRLFGREMMPTYAHEYLAERLRVGLVFGEGGRLFNHLTLRENVALPLIYHQPLGASDDAVRVEALLQATGLEEWAEQAPSEVNPSWRQRAALARALALKPEVLLLDNPMALLDPRQARWWVDFLDQLSVGHPLLDQRPLTLVVAVDDLRPWRLPNLRFGLLEEGRFLSMSASFLLDASSPAGWRDLLAAELPKHEPAD